MTRGLRLVLGFTAVFAVVGLTLGVLTPSLTAHKAGNPYASKLANLAVETAQADQCSFTKCVAHQGKHGTYTYTCGVSQFNTDCDLVSNTDCTTTVCSIGP